MSLAGTWEFPGGKLEADESPQTALAREITEEFGCSISVGEKVTTTTQAYPFGEIELETYYATIEAGEPQASEHAEIRWVLSGDLAELEWAPADVPAVSLVVSHLNDPHQMPA